MKSPYYLVGVSYEGFLPSRESELEKVYPGRRQKYADRYSYSAWTVDDSDTAKAIYDKLLRLPWLVDGSIEAYSQDGKPIGDIADFSRE